MSSELAITNKNKERMENIEKQVEWIVENFSHNPQEASERICSLLGVSESKLSIHDIRNKLSPITHLITVITHERIDKDKWLPDAIDGAKRSVNYLAQREVYSR